MAVLSGQVLKTPYRVTFTASAGQRVFNVVSGDIGGKTDINAAKSIELYATGVRQPASAHSITAALQITSDDPLTGPGTGWSAGTTLEFVIWFFV